MYNQWYSNGQPDYNDYTNPGHYSRLYFDPNYYDINQGPYPDNNNSYIQYPPRPHSQSRTNSHCPPQSNIPSPSPDFNNGTYRPPKFPRYNDNNYNEPANVQQLSTPRSSTVTRSHHQSRKVQELHSQFRNQPSNHKNSTAFIAPMEKVRQEPKQITGIGTIEADKFMVILKRLISPDGLKLVEILWISEVQKLISIILKINDADYNQTFYDNIRENCTRKEMDPFKMLQVWTAMFLINPEVCLKTKTKGQKSILLKICIAVMDSMISSKLSKPITGYYYHTIQAYFESLLPHNVIPINYNLERPYAKRIQKDLKTFNLHTKPNIFTIRREAGFFKSKITHGIDKMLDLVKILIQTRESDVDIEMSMYLKIESIVAVYSETSNSRFEFVACLLNERFDLPKNVLENVLVVKKKLWTACTILNCSDIPCTNYQIYDDLPFATLDALDSAFKSIFHSGMKEFYELVAIRQHLGLTRSYPQMSEIDTFMSKKCRAEYCWNLCVKNIPMKSRKDFANKSKVLPEKNPQFVRKTQLQPLSKPKDVIDLTKDKDDSSQHSKKNDEAAVAKVNELMDILNTLIKPYAVNREDKLWKDKISVFRSILIYPKNESSFIDELRNRCRNCKLDRIAMLRIWIELSSTNFNVLLEGKTHTEHVVIKILARAYLNAVDETGRKRLGELLTIRKHLMGSLPSDALSKGDIDLMSKPYVQRLMADNLDLIFKSKNRKADKILKAINPYKKTSPVSTIPIAELLKQKVTKSVTAIGIDKLLHEAKFLLKTKKNDVVSQMKSFAKIVRITKEHSSASKDSDFEFIDCLLTEPFRKKKGTLQGRLLLWAVCAILNYAHITDKKYDLPEPTVVYLSRHFKSSLVEKKDRLEFVALRQHLGRHRSHQMSKIDIYADEMCRSKFNWRNRVETSRRLSREDFVTPEENLKCHPALAYTFHVNNDDSRKTSKQIESNDDSTVNDSDCESETSSVEILSDVEKPPAPIVDLFSSDEDDDEISKPDELETALETEAESSSSSNQTNNAILNQDNVSNAHSGSEEQQTSTSASDESNDLNQLNEQIPDNVSNDHSNGDQIGEEVPYVSHDLNQVYEQSQDLIIDFTNTGGQKTNTKVLHEPTCKLNRFCKKSKSRIVCQSTCPKTTIASSSSKITSSTKRVIECTCSQEFIKANRPSSVSNNKPDDNAVEKVSPIIVETEVNDLPGIIGIPYEVLNAKQFVTYIWDNNLVKLVEEPVALEIEKEVANLLTLPFLPDISVQEQQDNQKTE